MSPPVTDCEPALNGPQAEKGTFMFSEVLARGENMNVPFSACPFLRNINGANNGIVHPYQMHQQGYFHPQYSAAVRRSLDRIGTELNKGRLTDVEVAARVQALAEGLRTILQRRLDSGRLNQLR